MFTIEKLYHSIRFLPQPWRILVAYSGGLDSHVLLQSLARLRDLYPMQLRAIHIHHGLSPQADAWVLHCQRTCEVLDIPLVVKKVTLSSDAIGIEAAARNARYQAISATILPEECVVLAHTEDDQAETILLQLLRGAGIKGMAAIPKQKLLGTNLCIRPLLHFNRAALMQYALEQDLQWIEDESNASLVFDRNYLRHKILPAIQTRWPGAKKVLARTAKHCAEAADLMEELAQEDCQKAQGSVAHTLSIEALKRFSPARQKNLLRFWLRQLQLPVPSSVKLTQLLAEVLEAREDAAPRLHWPGAEIYRYQNNLYALRPLMPHDPMQQIAWDMQVPLILPASLGVLTTRSAMGQGFVLPLDAKISVRFRHGGERLQPKGRIGSHPLKKLFQEWQVPPWQRDRIPLIYIEEKLIGVVGFAVAKDCAVSGDKLGKLVEWSPR